MVELDLTKLVSTNLSAVIQFSTNKDMLQSCLNSLGISKSSEVEKTIYDLLNEWNTELTNVQHTTAVQTLILQQVRPLFFI